MLGQHNITIDQGATFSLNVRAVDSSNNNIFASATLAEAQLRETAQSSTVLATFACSFAANNASIDISLTPEQTQALRTKSMHWDLKVTWPDKELFIRYGRATLNFTVTRN